MAEAVFYDPDDPRRGVLAEAFLAVRDDPVDTSWSSWIPWPGGTEPGKRQRAQMALMQWHGQVRSHGWKRPDTLVVAAIYSAANMGIRDDYMRALEERVGPKLTRSSYVTADQGWVESAAELAKVMHRMDALLAVEARILGKVEQVESWSSTATAVGVTLAVLGAAWIASR